MPPPIVTDGSGFVCVRAADLNIEAWIEFVGTRWSPAEARDRLESAWIPCIFDSALCGTCVLRPKGGDTNLWILETLKARSGYGRRLMNHCVRWIYDHYNKPFILGFVWELSLPALVGAWTRGWLSALAELQYGWVYRVEGCSFCPPGKLWKPVAASRFVKPTLFRDPSSNGWAIVNDSGMGDGWGHVCRFDRAIGGDGWKAIAKKGGWETLWCRSNRRPPGEGWQWTGEFVVVGLLNAGAASRRQIQIDWITAEI